MQAELMGTFGARLKRLLDEARMGQNELERRANLSKGAVSLYVNDRREQPRRDTMQRMADALGVPVARLAEDDPPEESAEHEISAHRRAEVVAEEFPALEEALILLEGKLDPRAQKLLLRKKTPENRGRSREWWLAQAREVQEEVKAIDRDWPTPEPVPGRGKPGQGRGKPSA